MPILTITLNPTIDISSDVEEIRPTHKMRTFNQRRHAGGGGINVARVIAELGGLAQAAFLSGGATGALLEETLAAMPLEAHAFRIEGTTRIAFMVHETRSNLEYRFVPEGPEVLPDELLPMIDLVRQFRGRYVVASGSLPLGVPETIYAEMSRLAQASGARFVLDTSGPALFQTLEAGCVYMVKPSRGELEKMSGRTLDDDAVAEVAASLVAEGKAEIVCVTLGAEGAIMASREGIRRLPAKKLEVRSAVGAGDSFVGAMVWALSVGWSLDDAFHLGVSAGAAAVLTPGTELCRKDDVLRLHGEG